MADINLRLAQALADHRSELIQELMEDKVIKTWINLKVSVDSLKLPEFTSTARKTTCFLIASQYSSIDVLKELAKLGSEVNIRDELENSSLIIACQSNIDRLQKITYLADYDKSSINSSNKEGSTPLKIAVGNGCRDATQLLLQLGADVNIKDNEGYTPLVIAAREGDIETVIALLDKGAHVNASNCNGWSSLMMASHYSYPHIVTVLLERGANVNAKNNAGLSVLMQASHNGRSEIVSIILKAGADINAKLSTGLSSLMLASQHGQASVVETLIQYGASVNARANTGLSPLMFAAVNGHTKIVNLLILANADLEAQGNDGRSPLICASLGGHNETVNELIQFGAKVNAQLYDGVTSLIAASQGGHTSIVHALIQAGADTNALSKERKSALTYASQNGHIDTVRKLVGAGADVNVQSIIGTMPIMLASQNGHTETVKALIQAKSNINTRNNDGRPPIMLASMHSHTKTILELVRAGADVNIQDNCGLSSLMLATQNGHMEAVNVLLESGADVNMRANTEWTALIIASQDRYTEIVNALLFAGAKVNTCGSRGESPLMLASQNGHIETVNVLLRANANVNAQASCGISALMLASQTGSKQTVTFLIQAGAKVNARTNDGGSSLMLASKNGHTEIVHILVNSGATVNAQTCEGESSLLLASNYDHRETVKTLIQAGADVNRNTATGASPLIVASQNDHVEIVIILLKSGADVNAESNNGGSPLLVASQKGYIKVVNALLEAGANVNMHAPNGGSPLIIALLRGHMEIVNTLIQAGAIEQEIWAIGDTTNQSSREENIEINIGTLECRLNKGCEIVAKEFSCRIPLLSSLKKRCTKHGIDISYINSLNEKINDKVTINLMGDLKLIADNIRREIGVTDLIETGSSSSGTRVGLPLEADYIFKNPPPFDNMGTFCDNVRTILPYTLPHGNNWSLLGTERHRAGICVILAYDNTIGVSFDVVPAVVVTEKDNFIAISRPKIEKFLEGHKIDLKESTIIKLFTVSRDSDYDTGILENQILQHLQEGKRSGYRVAKYLLQNDVCDGGRFCNALGDTYIELFGCAPILKSFYLRIIFLHLLVETFGTPLYDGLTEGVLTLCLLVILEDISNQLIENQDQGDIRLRFNHPLFDYTGTKFDLSWSCSEVKLFHERIHYVLYTYLENARAQDVSHYNLLNYPTVHTSSARGQADRTEVNPTMFSVSGLQNAIKQNSKSWSTLVDSDSLLRQLCENDLISSLEQTEIQSMPARKRKKKIRYLTNALLQNQSSDWVQTFLQILKRYKKYEAMANNIGQICSAKRQPISCTCLVCGRLAKAKSGRNLANEGGGEDEEAEDWGRVFDGGCSHGNTQQQVPHTASPTTKAVKSPPKPGKAESSDMHHPRTIIHIDVDCFYAQVEMIRNPALCNVPLGIQQKYIIVTCNYEARKHGVTKLMLVSDALKKCPQLVLVKGEDLTPYREMSYKITEHLSKYSRLVERLGFDENFIDVSEMVDVPPWTSVCSQPAGHVYGADSGNNAHGRECACGCAIRLVIGSHIAMEMRISLQQQLGITCCAGVAYNKLLAKMAGSTHKPNQQTTLFHEQVPAFMLAIDRVRSIPGIGSKCSKRLAGLGVTTVAELQQCDAGELADEFGEETATSLQQLSLGRDTSPVFTTGRPQSLSDEDSFKKCDNLTDARSRLDELLGSLLTRLLLDGRIAQTLRVSVRRCVPGERYPNRQSRQAPIPALAFRGFTAGNAEAVKEKLFPHVMKLFHKAVDVSRPFHLTLLNVCFSNLSEPGAGRGTIDAFFKHKSVSPPSKAGAASYAINKEATQSGREKSGLLTAPGTPAVTGVTQKSVSPDFSVKGTGHNTKFTEGSVTVKVSETKNTAARGIISAVEKQTGENSKVQRMDMLMPQFKEVAQREEEYNIPASSMQSSNKNHTKAFFKQRHRSSSKVDHVTSPALADIQNTHHDKQCNSSECQATVESQLSQNPIIESESTEQSTSHNEQTGGYEKTDLPCSNVTLGDDLKPNDKHFKVGKTKESTRSIFKSNKNSSVTENVQTPKPSHVYRTSSQINNDFECIKTPNPNKTHEFNRLSKLLPGDIDPHTFLELPSDIQKDLLHQANLSTNKVSDILSMCTSAMTYQGDNKRCEAGVYEDLRGGCEEQASTSTCHDDVNAGRDALSGSQTTRNSDISKAPYQSVAACQSHAQLPSPSHWKDDQADDLSTMPQVSERIKSHGFENNSNEQSNVKDLQDLNIVPSTSQKPPQSNNEIIANTPKKQSDSKTEPTPKKSTGFKTDPYTEEFIPPDIDKAVFLALPADMQRSLASEWRAKHEFEAMRKRKLSSPDSNKSAPKKKSSILSFFQKK